jgi:hypothetical protein
MKADATLVQAAFKEGQTGAMADVPSMKPLYDSTAAIGKTVMDTVTGIMDQVKLEKELESAAKEKRMQPISDLAKDVYSSIYDGGEPLPSIFVDSFTERIEELQDEFEKVNTEGKGDTKANEKKRREISGEFARLKNEAVNVRKNFMISTQDPEQWNIGRIADEDEAPLASIFGLWTDSKNMGGVTSKIVNGKLVVTAGGRSFNSEDVLKALNYKDKKSDSFVMSGITASATLGVADAKKEGALETSTYYNDVIKGQDSAEIIAYLRQNPTAFADMSTRGMEGLDGDAGLKRGLLSSKVLTTDIISTMFVNENGSVNKDLLKAVSELDIAGAKGGGSDGVLNSEDQKGLKGEALETFNKNWNIVEDAVTNPDSKYFNKEKSYKLLADYYTDFKEQSYNNAYAAQWKKDNPDKVTDYKTTKLMYEAKKAEVDFLLKSREFNANPPPVDHFKGVTKSNPISIRGIKINDKGSLEVIRERLLAGDTGFPIGDYIKVAPDGKGGWTMTKYDEVTGKVMEDGMQEYTSTEDFVKNGLNSTSPGFQNLKQYGEEEEIVLTEEEESAGIMVLNGKLYQPTTKDGKKGYIPYARK